MSTPRRRASLTVIDALQDTPQAFGFFQAVRLLERAEILRTTTPLQAVESKKSAYTVKNPVAQFVPPNTEIVRFHGNHSLNFPDHELLSIQLKSDTHQQWQLVINFMGLTGSMGVLPHHYTELILQRLKNKDHSLSHFLDLFNHRSISLFYQASCKYRLGLEYERNKLKPQALTKTDTHTQALLSLIGLGTPKLTQGLQINEESLLYYSGLFNQQLKTSEGLRQILQRHFNMQVEVQDFVAQWQDLIDPVRTRLVSKQQPKGQNACLGRSAILGSKCWYAQGKIRIILHAANQQQLNQFAPGTKGLSALNELVRLYVGSEHDYDCILRVRRADIPNAIQLKRQKPPVLGWDTWFNAISINSQLAGKDRLDIKISAGRLR